MLIVTLENIPNFSFEVIGAVSSCSVQSLYGMPLVQVENALDISRQKAVQKMTAQAVALKADAIIGVKYSTSLVTAEPPRTEVMVFGTAVKLVPLPSPVQPSVPPKQIA
eukprot:Trichotokara_eunicae@DN50_c0_g1_i1.p1